MKIFTTELKAIDPLDGKLKTWGGPEIMANSFEDAERYCQENGLGYLKVTGELVGSIESDYDGELNENRLFRTNLN